MGASLYEDMTDRSTGNIIEGHQLCFRYPHYNENGEVDSTQTALEDIDLEVQEGQFIAILGHNGSGKSTLARQLNALLLPTGGTLYVNGYDTRDESRLWDIRQSTGMVFQNPDNQIIASVVEEDVGFGPENMGVPTEDIWKRVKKALGAVGMWEMRESSPDRLSGGQKQRVAIAGVLAMKPRCIVLDEPTAMLDPGGRAEVISTVRELNRTEGVTVILITHYMEEVVDADRVIVMDKGRVVLTGTPREIFSQVDQLTNLRLSVPQVTLLAHALKEGGADLEDGILTREELIGSLEALRAENSAAGTGTAVSGAAAPAVSESGDAVPGEEVSAASMPGAADDSAHAKGSDTSDRAAGHDPEKAIEKEEPFIRAEHLGYIYEPGTSYEREALKDINLSIGKHEFTGIIGHTGSGKSTLIQHLNGLTRPTSGTIYVDGEDISAEGYPMRDLRFRVGLVFQYPEYQLFEENVLSDVSFGPKNQGLPEEEVLSRARTAMRAVGLDESFEKVSPFELSGGQKRRAAIAGILAMEPEVLVLDEPTAGLDPMGRDEILELLKKLYEEKDMTILLVSHSMEDVANYVNRIVVMDNGQILYDAVPEEVFSHVEELERIGLAAPQVTYVAHELRDRGWDVDDSVTTIRQAADEILRALGDK